MRENIDGFILTGTHGAPGPVLCGVQASGRLDGVLFELTLRQTYRNTLDRVLELSTASRCRRRRCCWALLPN